MANIEQNICDAIEVIANNIVSKAGFDKTIQATIISCTDEATGKYKVKYQDNTFYAYSNDISRKYTKNNRVYILIPGGDMTRDKTILGTVGQSTEYKHTEMGTVYSRISENFIYMQESEYQIYSGTAYNYNLENTQTTPYNRFAKVIYKYDGFNGSYPLRVLKERVISKYVEQAEAIQLLAEFKTNFAEAMTSGNYGITVFARCRREDGTEYSKPLTLDVGHGIYGDFYHLNDFVKVSYVIPKPDNFIRIERIEIFSKDFVNQTTGVPKYQDHVLHGTSVDIAEYYDITVKKLEIYAVNSIVKSVDKNGISLIYPKGTILFEGSNSTELPVKAEVIEQGVTLEPDTNKFFWFKKDASVNTVQNERYHSLGGFGWACLNNKNNLGEWEPALDTFNFTEGKHLLAYKNEFKVISYREVGTNKITHDGSFVLINDKNDIEIEIVSNRKRNVVPRYIEDLELQCNVISDEVNVTYSYYWNIESNGVSWVTEEEMKQNFYCSFSGNKISNIRLGNLSDRDKTINFTCTVVRFKNGQYSTLGSASLEFAIVDELSNPYVLEIVNGDQTFLYNEKGEAPTESGLLSTQPLFIRLSDTQKGGVVDLDEEISKGNLTIEWILPENPSMLSVTENDFIGEGTTYGGVTYHQKLGFGLKSPFVYDDLDSNVIQVKIKYGDIELFQTTNFTFLKQGNNGTNGTEYTARIIPRVESNKDIPRWVVFTSTGTTSGYFNFKQYENNENYYEIGYVDELGESHSSPLPLPFKAQLIRNGEIIYDNNIDETVDNKFNIKIDWTMNVKTYSSNYQDRSNFAIIKNGNFFSIQYFKNLYEEEEYEDLLNTREDLDHTPANILKCEIEYTPLNEDGSEDTEKTLSIYAYLPIVTITGGDLHDIQFDIESGFNEVIYNRDSCIPQYNNIKNEFYITTEENLVTNKCKWYIQGHSDLIKEKQGYRFAEAGFLTAERLEEPNNYRNDVRKITPAFKFNGESFTNAVLFVYNNETYIHIPIDMHLNLFGLGMLNKWDGKSIEINEEGGYILSPQIGAGYKDSNNKFTGIVMGQAKDSAESDMHPGLFAYKDSERTFGLMADSGICAIGKAGRSQIVIDPRDGHYGCIYSGNFFNLENSIDKKTGFVKEKVLDDLWTRYIKEMDNDTVEEDYVSGEGMIIDLTDGRILYGNGKFYLNENGQMTCIDGHFSNKIKRLYDFENGKINSGSKVENFFVDVASHDESDYAAFGDDRYKVRDNDYFLYCRPKNESGYSSEKRSFSVTKDGKLFSNMGEIGGFIINESNFTSYKDITKTKHNGKSIITLSNVGFSRDNMNVVTAYSDNNTLYDPEELDINSISSNISNELLDY